MQRWSIQHPFKHSRLPINHSGVPQGMSLYLPLAFTANLISDASSERFVGVEQKDSHARLSAGHPVVL